MTIQVIRIGSSKQDNPLNTLGAATRDALYQSLMEASHNSDISAIVLCGNNPQHFSAGADLKEFNSFSQNVITLPNLLNFMESSQKPIVAAMSGVALGGGCEVALACHYRICDQSVQIGLPEVKVGVIPGAGGTQRLPRLVGIQKSLDIILSGNFLNSNEALQCQLVNAVCHPEQSVLECAKQWAAWAQLLVPRIPRVSEMKLKESPAEVNRIVMQTRSKLPLIHKGGEGVHAALGAIQASALDFKKGMEREQELFFQTLTGTQGRARRHSFLATRSQKISKIKLEYIKEVGVIGAGTMGSGIALVLLLQGNFEKVYLVDVQPAALEKGMAFMHKTLDSYVKRGKLSPTKSTEFKQKLVGTCDLTSLANCRLIVEAVVENMAVKQGIFRKLDSIVLHRDALLLSNTSTLDIAKITSVLSPDRQAYSAGWHFFSPAHVMKLVEIVVSHKTSPETSGILQSLSKKIQKISVVVGNCDGFVGNRMLNPYTSEMVLLLTEGISVESIDTAMQQDFGMAIGPFLMSDLAGNDIGYFIRKERGLVRDPKTLRVGPKRTPGMRYTELADDMVTDLGRIGQKVLKGWYDYDAKVGKGRKPIPSKEVADFCQRYVVSETNEAPLSSEEIVERILFPLVNEGFKILEEGIAQKPSDIDVVYLYGYGWPVWRGGPMFWADHEVGLPRLLSRLEEFHERYPGSAYYVPSKLLQRCVSMGVMVEEYYQKGLNKQNGFSKL